MISKLKCYKSNRNWTLSTQWRIFSLRICGGSMSHGFGFLSPSISNPLYAICDKRYATLHFPTIFPQFRVIGINLGLRTVCVYLCIRNLLKSSSSSLALMNDCGHGTEAKWKSQKRKWKNRKQEKNVITVMPYALCYICYHGRTLFRICSRALVRYNETKTLNSTHLNCSMLFSLKLSGTFCIRTTDIVICKMLNWHEQNGKFLIIQWQILSRTLIIISIEYSMFNIWRHSHARIHNAHITKYRCAYGLWVNSKSYYYY